MMTTSRKRTRHPGARSPRSLMLGAAICFLLLVFAAAMLWREQAAGLFWAFAAPVLSMRNSVAASENQRLRDTLASTLAALADRDVLYRENLDLKNRLGRDAGVERILAGVLLRPPAMPYDTLMLDAGTRHGVAQGDLVSAGGTTLIGVVAQTYSTTARVVLFSAPGQTYQALLRLSAEVGREVPVSVEGQGGGSLTTQVPAGTAARVGDVIVFPGVAGGFSGIVSAVDTKEGESFATLYTHLPVSPLSLAWVEVWKQRYVAE